MQVGGELLEPVANLLTSLGDSILSIIHNFVMDQEHSIIHSSSGLWQTILSVIIGIGIVVALISIPIGLGLPALGMGVVVLAGTFGGIFAFNGLTKNIVSLPVYSISPEEIFMGNVPLLDINFFNPDSNKSKYESLYASDPTNKELSDLSILPVRIEKTTGGRYNEYKYTNFYFNSSGENYKITIAHNIHIWEEITVNKDTGRLANNGEKIWDETKKFIQESTHNIQESYWTRDHSGELEEYIKNEEWNYQINKIFQKYGIYNEFILNNNPVYTDDGKTVTATAPNGCKIKIENLGTNEEKVTLVLKYVNIASDLQKPVAKWYFTLRNVALVFSMSILVYIGIRMMLTSVASQKAKFKNMLFDWLIGVCLIFVMHYIMVFAVNFNDIVIDIVNSMGNFTPKYTSALKSGTKIDDVINKYAELKGLDVPDDMTYAESITNSEGYIGYETNLMGNVRLLIQNNRDESLSYVGYVIMFLVLVFYTAFFLVTYIKRVIYMAILTILAPFVAMTYPLDKTNDGQAQAFNMWIKEYIFNLLIQPMHLLLYYILVSSALQLATKNLLYSLVAIGFMMPAEKIIRKFFGFDKAQTPGLLNGAVGAGIVMSAVGSLRKFAGSGGSDKGASGKSDNDKNGKVRTKDKDASIDIKDTEFGKAITDAEKEMQREITRKSQIQSVVTKQLKERLDELKSDNLGEGDSEYDRVKKELELSIKKSDHNQAKQNSEIINIVQNKTEEGEKQSQRTLAKSIRGAVGGVAGGMLRSGAKLTGSIPGLAAKGFGAATLGAVGLAAGITTGNPSSALKYTLAGAGAGSALGEGLLNRATNTATNIADDAIRGFYGDDYDKYLNSQSDREFFASKDARNEYRAEFGSNYKDRMKDALEYRKLGITDDTIIIRAMRFPKEYGGSNMTAKEKLYIAQLASQISSRNDLARLVEQLLRKGIAPGKIDAIEEGIRIIKKWD